MSIFLARSRLGVLTTFVFDIIIIIIITIYNELGDRVISGSGASSSGNFVVVTAAATTATSSNTMHNEEDRLTLLISSLHLNEFYINGTWMKPVMVNDTIAAENDIHDSCQVTESSSSSVPASSSSKSCPSSSSSGVLSTTTTAATTTFFNIIDPSTAKSVANLSIGTYHDVDAAVQAAKYASTTYWSHDKTSPQQRQKLVQRLLELFIDHTEQLATLVSTEMGSPYLEAFNSQVGGAQYNIESFLNLHHSSFDYERPLPNIQQQQQQRRNNNNIHPIHTTIRYEPIGVVGLITPWNWSLHQLTLKIIPALLVGCTCVIKPSEQTTLSTALLAHLVHKAQFPPGVVNFVWGDGPTTGHALTNHPNVDMISFTGSTTVGRQVASIAGQHLTKTTLELGGKGAYIVFADLVDSGDDENDDEEWIQEVVKDGVDRVMDNTGQSCNAPTRMFIERPYYQKAIQWAKEAADETNVASAHYNHHRRHDSRGDEDEDEEETLYHHHIGPVVNQRQFDRIQHYIQVGIDEGATLVTGGLGRPDHMIMMIENDNRHDHDYRRRGYYVRPTIFADCTPTMTIMKDEIFGPVLCITPFDTEQHVIDMANDTPYGLTNYVYSRNLARRRRLANVLQSGMVEMNDAYGDDGSPFGGIKASGYGREGGIYGLEEFCTIKAITGYNELEDDEDDGEEDDDVEDSSTTG